MDEAPHGFRSRASEDKEQFVLDFARCHRKRNVDDWKGTTMKEPKKLKKLKLAKETLVDLLKEQDLEQVAAGEPPYSEDPPGC